MVADPTPEVEVKENAPPIKEKRRAQLLLLVFGVLLLVAAVGWFLMHLGIPIQWIGPGDGVFKVAPMLWLDWLLIALCGVLLYVVSSIAYWYTKAKARFVAFTPWYASTIVKGPILALVILLFLTNISFTLSGVDVDFGKLDANVLVVVAFVLGFYSRVAREQLNQIVKGLFGKAYGTAEEAFTIVPSRAQVVFGQTLRLRTSSAVDVTWITTAGTIQDGLFTAPSAADATSGQVVQISAVPKDANIPRAVAQVTLVAFEIAGKERIVYASKELYQVVPAPEAGVDWTVTPEIKGASIDASGLYTAPAEADAKAAGAEKVTITATEKQKKENVASKDVSLA